MLLKLPVELHARWLAYLRATDVQNVLACCKELRAHPSHRLIWYGLFTRDFDVDLRDVPLLAINPAAAYKQKIRRRRECEVTTAQQRMRGAQRKAATSAQTVLSAKFAALSITAWVFAPAICSFVFLLLLGLRADGAVDWPWPVAFVPALVLCLLQSVDVAAALAMWMRERNGWWSPCQRVGPPAVFAPRPASPAAIVAIDPVSPTVDHSLSPWHGARERLHWAPAVACTLHITGEQLPGVILAVMLFILGLPVLVISLAVQANTVTVAQYDAPSWAVALLPCWMFFGLLPLACCACSKLRANPDSMACFAGLLIFIAMPALATLISMAVSFDQRQRFVIESASSILINGTNGGNETAAGNATIFAEDSGSMGSTPLPLHLALIPIWVLGSLALLGLGAMSAVSCVRFRQARLEDLSSELVAVQSLAFAGVVVIAAPIATLACVAAKADGALVSLAWLRALAPVLSLLALLCIVTCFVGMAACDAAVVGPCRARSKLRLSKTLTRRGGGRGGPTQEEDEAFVERSLDALEAGGRLIQVDHPTKQ